MPEPLTFSSATSRHALPLLFVAQAQKEAFINEALTRIDALLQCAVEEERNAPPAAPQPGEMWLVGSSPTADWAGAAGSLACHEGAGWTFIAPRPGMLVFDKARDQWLVRANGWELAEAVPLPSGGTVVDVEARAAITALVNALRIVRVLPSDPV